MNYERTAGLDVVLGLAEHPLHRGGIPIVFCLPHIRARIVPSPGSADLVDVVISQMLTRGFALLGSLAHAELAAAPAVAGWHASLDLTRARAHITGPDAELLYDGTLGPIPEAFASAMRASSTIALVIVSGSTLGEGSNDAVLTRAVQEGRAVAATIPADCRATRSRQVPL